jgi:hypothetical protein
VENDRSDGAVYVRLSSRGTSGGIVLQVSVAKPPPTNARTLIIHYLLFNSRLKSFILKGYVDEQREPGLAPAVAYNK